MSSIYPHSKNEPIDAHSLLQSVCITCNLSGTEATDVASQGKSQSAVKCCILRDDGSALRLFFLLDVLYMKQQKKGLDDAGSQAEITVCLFVQILIAAVDRGHRGNAERGLNLWQTLSEQLLCQKCVSGVNKEVCKV